MSSSGAASFVSGVSLKNIVFSETVFPAYRAFSAANAVMPQQSPSATAMTSAAASHLFLYRIHQFLLLSSACLKITVSYVFFQIIFCCKCAIYAIITHSRREGAGIFCRLLFSCVDISAVPVLYLPCFSNSKIYSQKGGLSVGVFIQCARTRYQGQ